MDAALLFPGCPLTSTGLLWRCNANGIPYPKRQCAILPPVQAIPLAIQPLRAQNKNGRHPSFRRDRKASLGHSDLKKIPGTGEGESAAQVNPGPTQAQQKGGHR